MPPAASAPAITSMCRLRATPDHPRTGSAGRPTSRSAAWRATATRRRRCCRCRRRWSWLRSTRLMPLCLLVRISVTASASMSSNGSNRSRAMWATSTGTFGAARAERTGRRTCAGRRTGTVRTAVGEGELHTALRWRRAAPVPSRRNWPLMPRCAIRASPSVNGSQRNLPLRRFGSVNVRPTRPVCEIVGSTRCAAGRVAGGAAPVTPAKRCGRAAAADQPPVLTTSTSGSSGIRRRRLLCNGQPRRQGRERVLRRAAARPASSTCLRSGLVRRGCRSMATAAKRLSWSGPVSVTR